MIQLEMAQKAAEVKKTEAEALNLQRQQGGEDQNQLMELQQQIERGYRC